MSATLDTQLNETFKLLGKKRYYTNLGTSALNNPMQCPLPPHETTKGLTRGCDNGRIINLPSQSLIILQVVNFDRRKKS